MDMIGNKKRDIISAMIKFVFQNSPVKIITCTLSENKNDEQINDFKNNIIISNLALLYRSYFQNCFFLSFNYIFNNNIFYHWMISISTNYRAQIIVQLNLAMIDR